MLQQYPENMSDDGPKCFMVQKNSVITNSDLIAQTKPNKSFWGRETPAPMVFSLYFTNSVITTDALDGEVVLGTVNIPTNTPILTADYHAEGLSEAFVLGDAKINLQQDSKGKRLGTLSVSSDWMKATIDVEKDIESDKCDVIKKRLTG